MSSGLPSRLFSPVEAEVACSAGETWWTIGICMAFGNNWLVSTLHAAIALTTRRIADFAVEVAELTGLADLPLGAVVI